TPHIYQLFYLIRYPDKIITHIHKLQAALLLFPTFRHTMADLQPLYALFAIVPIFLAAFYSFAHRRTHGILATTTTSVAYDHATHASILSWDRYTLLLEGRPTPILSGEFHYWRLPDRSRWEPTLRQYRSAGLNAIRIYFHWGYHSPKEGVYHFDGNRDIDYLLTLCSRLGILVLAAPGPYICAETQAGGFPTWLIAKRDLRIRHNKYMLWKVYDDVFAGHEMEWYEKVLGIIAKHQATNKPGDDGTKGCVIGVQIDNELFELMGGLLPIGLHDQMRVLAKAARDYGITVPLFSNDGFEEGSWVPKPLLDKDPDSFWSKKKFGLDWYGFDKYVVLAPTSSPKSWVINNELHSEQWSEWNPLTVEHSVDNLEKTVRKFGHGAAASPLFIPELQGGWFNHYQLQHTYDDIFTFYGEQYTRTIFESILAQGTTMASIYMFYGGTNWGTLGDPDVYTSYDYSACIREYGYFSSRARLLRLTLLFARSFAPLFARTDRAPVISVTTSVPHVLNLQRVSVPKGTDRPVEFDVTLLGSNVTLTCHLPYKKSFIALGSYTTTTGARLEFSTVPIYLRMLSPPGTPPTEIWIADLNSAGQIAFEGTVEASGTLGPVIDVRGNGKINVVSFAKTRGWARIVRGAGEGGLYLTCPDSISQ
ncbi:glycoside hydrolase superfamily, partial [Endogone sp. FLAS-F59071]